MVFVLLSFRETDHTQASWEIFNYETKSLLTRYEMKEETIGLFSFVPPTLDTLPHEHPCVSSPVLHCFLLHSFIFSCSHFSVSFLCFGNRTKDSNKFHAAAKMKVLLLDVKSVILLRCL